MNFAPFSYLSSKPSISFSSSTFSTASLLSYTFTNLNIGSGLSVICVHAEVGAAGRTVNSVVVGGVTSSQAAQISSTQNSTATTAAIFYIRQSSSNPNIVVTFNLAPSRCMVSIYKILNNKSDIPNQTRTAVATSGTGLSLVFTNLIDNSVGVAAETIGLDSVTSVAWTNANLTYDTRIAAGATRTTGAIFTIVNSENRTVSVSHTNSTQPLTLAGCVWI